MREFWEERKYYGTAGGSLRYKTGGRIVYGINVSGQLADAPIGELDIWVNTDKLAEVSGVAKDTINQQLSKNFKSFEAGRMKFVIRLKNTKEVELLVAQLGEFSAEPPPTKKSAAVA